MTARESITIVQGATFDKSYRWEVTPVIYKPITAITQSAPVQITAVGHGVPDGWRIAVSNVAGMTEINARMEPPEAADYHRATVINDDTLELNLVNSLGFTAYTSGGVIRYFTPRDLTGFTARLQIREFVESEDVILELTTENGGIIIDAALSKVTIHITDIQTAALDFETAVFHLEMVDSGNAGDVTRLLEGDVTLSREATR